MPKWRVLGGWAFPWRNREHLPEGTVFEATRERVERHHWMVEEIPEPQETPTIIPAGVEDLVHDSEQPIDIDAEDGPIDEWAPFPPPKKRGRPPRNRAFPAPPEDRAY